MSTDSDVMFAAQVAVVLSVVCFLLLIFARLDRLRIGRPFGWAEGTCWLVWFINTIATGRMVVYVFCGR